MAPPLLSLAASGTTAASAQATTLANGKALVACFSRSGNTLVIARQVRRSLGADLFEIEPATPYPDDYFETVEQAERERDRDFEPPLKAMVANMADYSTVFVGFPIWGMTVPPIIRSFLSEHDLSSKTVIPLITHGGYGLGDSIAVLTRHTPRVQITEGFAMEAPQERKTIERVGAWLDGVRSAR